MFRLECFVDDKKLGDALRALVGIAVQPPTVQPVTNAKKGRNGHLQQESNGKLLDLFMLHLDKEKPGEINAKYVRAFLERNGTSPGSANYLLQQLRDTKRIKKDPKSPKQGIGVKYHVLPPKPPTAPKTKTAAEA